MTYTVIMADPPWPQRKGGLRAVRPGQDRTLDYRTSSLNTIEDHLKTTSPETAHSLFLWTIDKFLLDAEGMVARLGYKLHARFIWDKQNGVAPAFTVRYSHEYLLWLYQPKLPHIAKEARGKFPTVFREPATQHSRKPKIAYEMIEALYPDSKRLEMYARYYRRGWDGWGDEYEDWQNLI